MPSGLFGKAKITAINTVTQIAGPVPAGKTWTANLRVTNPGAVPVKVKAHISTAVNPTAADLQLDQYTPQVTVVPTIPMDETAIVMGPGERLFFESDTLAVIGRASGMEENA